MKQYEEPKMDVTRFELEDTLTSDPAEVFSSILDYDQGVEEW